MCSIPLYEYLHLIDTLVFSRYHFTNEYRGKIFMEIESYDLRSDSSY